MSAGHLCFRKRLISTLYFYTSLHSADQGELCLTAKKIGKDFVSPLKKYETLQGSIISLEDSHYKDVVDDITC